MRHLDLFSGIGGFALACRMVGGIETVGFCEREPYAQRVLKKHWPDVPICNDIHEMKGNEYGPIDLITGGFPCQPYSLAGERRGNEDDRALWPEMLRVIRGAKPAWVLAENVAGIVSLALDGVLADLEGSGYYTQSFIIPACAVDAKHRRDRVWIVAHNQSTPWQPSENEAHARSSGWKSRNGLECVREALANSSGGENIGGECRDVAEASGCGAGSNASAVSGGKAVVCNATIERLPDWAGGEMGQPFPITEFERSSGREIERDFRGMAHGVSRRVDRLRGLGNAIVPQVAAEIIKAMKETKL